MPDASPNERARLESRALWVGAWSGLGMGGLGFAFGILTGSEAIMLDGVFSVVGFAVALATIRVAQIIRQPADAKYHFGYASFEPLITMCKGVVIGFVSLFALISSVQAILTGGREISPGWGFVYAVIAATGCGAVAAYMRGGARKTGSTLLDVDVRNWAIDGVLSAAVGVAFLIAFLLSGTGVAWIVPYIDPGLVIVLVLFIVPVPIKIALTSMRELLGGAPEPALQDQIRRLLQTEFVQLEDVHPHVRLHKAGRFVYVQIYLLVPSDIEIKTVDLLDDVRTRIHAVLQPEFPDLSLDVVFTGPDGGWARASVGSRVPDLGSPEAPDQGTEPRAPGVSRSE